MLARQVNFSIGSLHQATTWAETTSLRAASMTSSWVVSAGGTTINRDASGNFVSESCWAGSGGGTSVYELWSSTFGAGNGPWTAFQVPLAGATVGQSARRTPDMSFDADPASGAYVRYNGAWYVVGGTSLSAPALAGIVNNSNNRLGVAPSPGGFFGADEGFFGLFPCWVYGRVS